MTRTVLLTIDSIIDLLLGAVLVAFPRSVIGALGIPDVASAFYPSILGGVLFGIGIALWMERSNRQRRAIGLGLGGAVAITLCGGIVLGLWLVFANLNLPLRGMILLWALTVILVGLSLIEIVAQRSNAD